MIHRHSVAVFRLRMSTARGAITFNARQICGRIEIEMRERYLIRPGKKIELHSLLRVKQLIGANYKEKNFWEKKEECRHLAKCKRKKTLLTNHSRAILPREMALRFVASQQLLLTKWWWLIKS